MAAAVKLHRLLDASTSPLAGYDIEMASLRQVVAFLEHAAGASADPVPAEPEVRGFPSRCSVAGRSALQM
jgi:hypothetical protein